MQKIFNNILPVSQVISWLKQALPLTPQTLPLTAALSCYLAADYLAPEDLPAANRSSMDGYAVRAEDLFGATEFNPVWLDEVGQININTPPRFSLNPNQCASIVTGGYLPEQANAVIMVEHTKTFGANTIEMRRSLAPNENIMLQGADAKQNQLALTQGTLLRPQELGLLAALGQTQIAVHQKPQAVIISTGDELVPPEITPKPGQIRDVNSLALTAMLTQAGFHAQSLGIVKDDATALKLALQKALPAPSAIQPTPANQPAYATQPAPTNQPAPAVIFLSGGSSIGTRDFTLEVLNSLPNTEIFCHGIALSPGKPLILAKHHQNEQATYIFGLPGQVASAQVVMFVLGLPFMAHLSGKPQAFNQNLYPQIKARLTRNIASKPGREDYVRISLAQNHPETLATPITGPSGLLTTLINSQGLVAIDSTLEGLEAGSMVQVLLF